MAENELTCINYDEKRIVGVASTLFIIDGEEVWLPNSQIGELFEEDKEVWIPGWLAILKDLV